MAGAVGKFVKDFNSTIDSAPDAKWTVIRRIKFADKLRSKLYGLEKARPFGRKARNSWARMISWYTRSKLLRYCEAEQVAEHLARQLQREGVDLTFSEPFDAWLRERLSEALTEAAKRKAAGTPPRDSVGDEIERRGAKLGALIRQACLDNRCPWCGGGVDRPEACEACSAIAEELVSRR